MKLVFTLALLTIHAFSEAQVPVSTTTMNGCRVRISSVNANKPVGEPIYIIDGVVSSKTDISALDVNRIKEVSVLKGEYALSLFGSLAENGMIIVTTKKTNEKKFRVIDLVTGEPVPLATLEFVHRKNKHETLSAAADSAAWFRTDKLDPTLDYMLTVSSAGYISKTYEYNRGAGDTITLKLEKAVKEMEPAFFISYWNMKRNLVVIKCSFGDNRKKAPVTETKTDTPSNYRVFPNPAPAGRAITITMNNKKEQAVRTELIDMSGRLMQSSTAMVLKGNYQSQITPDSRLVPGTYILRVVDAKGVQLFSSKLLIQ